MPVSFIFDRWISGSGGKGEYKMNYEERAVVNRKEMKKLERELLYCGIYVYGVIIFVIGFTPFCIT